MTIGKVGREIPSMLKTRGVRRALWASAGAAAVLGALAGVPAVAGESADPCAAIPGQWSTVTAYIEAAREQALTNAQRNGTTGIYASAARDTLTQLDHALVLAYQAQPYADASPGPGGYAQAYQVHALAMDIAGALSHAQHWGAISFVYDRGADARTASELSGHAQELTAVLDRLSLACYMNGYP